jgi:hypothetical protein
VNAYAARAAALQPSTIIFFDKALNLRNLFGITRKTNTAAAKAAFIYYLFRANLYSEAGEAIKHLIFSRRRPKNLKIIQFCRKIL